MRSSRFYVLKSEKTSQKKVWLFLRTCSACDKKHVLSPTQNVLCCISEIPGVTHSAQRMAGKSLSGFTVPDGNQALFTFDERARAGHRRKEVS